MGAVLLIVFLGIGLWRSRNLWTRLADPERRRSSGRPTFTFPESRVKTVLTRVVIVIAAFAIVTGSVAFFRPSYAIWAGAAVLPIGVWWVFRAADPTRIDMDDLDRELMDLLNDEM